MRDKKDISDMTASEISYRKFLKNLGVTTHKEIEKLINKKIADTYIAELFLALSQDALNKSSQGFKKLVADSQTPKGLNMQVLNELKKGKFFTKFTKALENVNKRVSK